MEDQSSDVTAESDIPDGFFDKSNSTTTSEDSVDSYRSPTADSYSVYYDTTENFPDEGSEPGMYPYDCNTDFFGLQGAVPSVEVVDEVDIVDLIDDALEENNNDPNNNMDSIETSDAGAAGPSGISDRVIPPINRSESPKPGCSKDSGPSSLPGCSKDSRAALPREESLDEQLILEKTRHILSLVSKIHRDSVFDVLARRHDVPISELRLWDLLPESERLGYPEVMECGGGGDEESRENFRSEKSTANGFALKECAMTNGVKRGPEYDICTVESKKPGSHGAIPKIAEKPRSARRPPTKTRRWSQDEAPIEITKFDRVGVTRAAPLKPDTIEEEEEEEEEVEIRKAVETAVILLSENVSANSAAAAPLSTVPSTLPPTKPVDHLGAIPKIRQEPSSAKRAQSTNQPKVAVAANAGKTATSPELIRDHIVYEDPRAKRAEAQQKNPRSSSTKHMPMVIDDSTVKSASTRPAPRPDQPSRNVVVKSGVLKYPTRRRQETAVPVREQQPQTSKSAAPVVPAVSLPNWPASLNAHSIPVASSARLPVVPTVRVATAFPKNAAPYLSEATDRQDREKQQSPVSAAAASASAQPQQPPAQNLGRPVCMDMYYKLIAIFPNVDRDYLKKLCPPEWGPGDRDAQLDPIIEHLLERGPELPQAPVKRAQLQNVEPNALSIDNIYETLRGIFPDADPHYLREFAVRSRGDNETVKTFVERQLEHRDYPTKEQYMARLKITEQQRQYTTGFSVRHFLSVFPDPAKHFMDKSRKCTYQTVAFEFLKSHFNRTRVSTISAVYAECNYNLSRTVSCLEQQYADLKNKRVLSEMPTEDIELLQEIAFVKHKKEIDRHNEKLDEAFRTMKAKNELLECQCCYDSECMPMKCSSCDNGHVFCNNCVIAGTNAKMGEDQTHIHCFLNCGSEFSLSTLQRVLVPTTFSILLKKRQAAEVMEAGLEGLVSCPFCHFASIPPEGDKIFQCKNPECFKESCRLCKELNHVPLKCDEVMKADKARRYIEEKMTEALARKCYKCQRAYFKEEGCNKITCPCGASMCYLCDEPIKDYKHFRGQGSNDTKLCPLYSDTIRLDAVAVRKVAEQAQLQLLKQHPNIKVDATDLLPAIPRPRQGPHADVLNADELPRRAARVVDFPPHI